MPIRSRPRAQRTTYKYPPFLVTLDETGAAVKIVGSSRSTTRIRFFGTCEPGPKDIVGYVTKFTLTPTA